MDESERKKRVDILVEALKDMPPEKCKEILNIVLKDIGSELSIEMLPEK